MSSLRACPWQSTPYGGGWMVVIKSLPKMRVMIGWPNDFDPLLDSLSPQHQKGWDYVADYLEGWLRPLSPMPPATTTHWGQTRLPSLCPLTYCTLLRPTLIILYGSRLNATSSVLRHQPGYEMKPVSNNPLSNFLSNFQIDMRSPLIVDHWYKTPTFAFGQEDIKINIPPKYDSTWVEAIHKTWLWR